MGSVPTVWTERAPITTPDKASRRFSVTGESQSREMMLVAVAGHHPTED